MVEVVAEDQVIAVDVFVFEGEAEFEAVEVGGVRGVGEVGGCGGGVGGEAAVVLDADGEGGGEAGGGDGGALGGVDGDGALVLVGWAGGDGEDVVFCAAGHGS